MTKHPIDYLTNLVTDYAPGYHAKVLERVAKSHIPLKAVVFKSEKRVLTRFWMNLPLTHSGVVGDDDKRNRVRLDADGLQHAR